MLRKILFFPLLIILARPNLTAYAGIIEKDLRAELEKSAPAAMIDVIIRLEGKMDTKSFKKEPVALRRAHLIHTLQAGLKIAQSPVIDWLNQAGVRETTSLWIINALAARVPATKIEALAQLRTVASVALDAEINAPATDNSATAGIGWNLDAIRARESWAAGPTGEGIIIALLDTGADAYHPALASKWRGGNNSWFDPYGQHAVPYDASGHGTGVLGLILGGDTNHVIGVAPGARWIAAKIFNDTGTASLSAIHEAFQWLLDPDGNPEINDAPDAVNNSWGLENSEGLCDPEFHDDIGLLELAEIAVIFSAGNTGSSAGSSLSPANDTTTLSVGAVNETLSVADFSGRGPSACGGIYPRITAPGVGVYTTDLTFGGLFPDTYVWRTGTSFAAPHITGAIAVLKSAKPTATVSQLRMALSENALDLGAVGPDNEYGAGLVDLVAAETWLQAQPDPPTDADGDGVPASDDCNDLDSTIFPGAKELKHDNIDQDCNGYDLTIEITKADYNTKRNTLTVEATSALGANAQLQLEGFGPMTWNKRKNSWSLALSSLGGKPIFVTVTGIEGSETRRL